jgi:hypothetical protein
MQDVTKNYWRLFTAAVSALIAVFAFTACPGGDAGDPNVDSGYICLKHENVPQTFGITVEVYGNLCTENEEGTDVCVYGKLTQIDSERVECFKFQDGAQSNVTIKIDSACFKDESLNTSLLKPLPLDVERDEAIACLDSGDNSQFYEVCNQYIPPDISDVNDAYSMCTAECNSFISIAQVLVCLDSCDADYKTAILEASKLGEKFAECCSNSVITQHQPDEACKLFVQ